LFCVFVVGIRSTIQKIGNIIIIQKRLGKENFDNNGKKEEERGDGCSGAGLRSQSRPCLKLSSR